MITKGIVMNPSKNYLRLMSEYDQIKSIGIQRLLDCCDDLCDMQQFMDALLLKLEDMKESQGIDRYLAEYAVIGLITCLQSFEENHVYNNDV
jgi:hypothetical protein